MNLVRQVLESVAPAFALIALGWLAGRKRLFEVRQFLDFALYFAQPALIISALAKSHIPLEQLLQEGLAACFVVGSVGAMAFIYSLATGDRDREVYLCAMFANLANLPVPLAAFAFGDAGLSYQIVYMGAGALLLYTAGSLIASGGLRGWTQMLRMPLLYAVVAGLVISTGGFSLPIIVMRPIDILGEAGIPVLLFTLGLKLGISAPVRGQRTAPIVALRVLGGLTAGVLFVILFDPPLGAKRAILLGSAMPSAVQSFMLSEKFSPTSHRAAATVFASTTFALIYVPLLLAVLMILR